MTTSEGLQADREPLSLVCDARALALHLLDDDEERKRHSAGVAARAASLSGAVAEGEASLLVAAAWLHDIGYAAQLRDTDFHPIDGARFLRSAGWDSTLSNLVAHHSGSRFVAVLRGFGDELSEFSHEENPVSDALTVADQTIGLNGRSLSLEERMRDKLERHGPDSATARAHRHREAYFRSAFERVTHRLQLAGFTGDVVQGQARPGQDDGPADPIEHLTLR